MQRVNNHIVFRQPTVEDMNDYLRELFRFYRLDERPCSPTFPFSPEAFALLVESSVAKTPRFLNKLCDMILREINRDSELDLADGRTISQATVAAKLPQLLGLLEEARG